MTFFTSFFHLYGLMIGFGVLSVFLIIEHFAKKYALSVKLIEELSWWSLLGGVVGARLYHVFTDFQLYQGHWLDIFKIWQGGLSILGAEVGVAVSLVWYFRTHHSSSSTKLKLFDILVLGVPIGQAIGRLGNYFNQELYGLPTHLPWAIFIDPAHRFPQYANQAYYHPLFAYEMFGLIVFVMALWWIEHQGWWRVGSGKYGIAYLFFYPSFRFLLDFWRIDKATFLHTPLGLNQVILLIFLIGFSSFMWWRSRKCASAQGTQGSSSLSTVLGVGIILLSGAVLTACQAASPHQHLASLPDHAQAQLTFGQRVISVEVVNTQESLTQGLSGRTQIGSDGMLFIMPRTEVQQFWMKEMKFGLDFIWLNNLTVVDLTEDVPAPDSSQDLSLLPIYSPRQAADMVLEVPSGTVTQWQLKIGDHLTLK